MANKYIICSKGVSVYKPYVVFIVTVFLFHESQHKQYTVYNLRHLYYLLQFIFGEFYVM